MVLKMYNNNINKYCDADTDILPWLQSLLTAFMSQAVNCWENNKEQDL